MSDIRDYKCTKCNHIYSYTGCLSNNKCTSCGCVSVLTVEVANKVKYKLKTTII